MERFAVWHAANNEEIVTLVTANHEAFERLINDHPQMHFVTWQLGDLATKHPVTWNEDSGAT